MGIRGNDSIPTPRNQTTSGSLWTSEHCLVQTLSSTWKHFSGSTSAWSRECFRLTVMIAARRKQVRGKGNKVLATLLRHMRRLTGQLLRLHIRWIRGHTGDVGTTIADRLAECSTQPAVQHLWWRGGPVEGRWEEDAFVAQIVSFSEGDHAVL